MHVSSCAERGWSGYAPVLHSRCLRVLGPSPRLNAGRVSTTRRASSSRCIQTGDLTAHMRQSAGPSPTRTRGPTGIRHATRVSPAIKRLPTTSRGLMQEAGYDVHLQRYQFDYYAYTGIPTIGGSLAGTDLVLGVDWGPGQSLGSMAGDAHRRRRTTCSRRRRRRARRPAAPPETSGRGGQGSIPS